MLPAWALLALAAALVVYGLRPAARWRLRRVPGPPVRWLLGMLPELAAQGWERAFEELAARHGGAAGVFKVFWGGHAFVVVADPLLARRVLRGSAQRFALPLPVYTPREEELLLKNMLLCARAGRRGRTERSTRRPP